MAWPVDLLCDLFCSCFSRMLSVCKVDDVPGVHLRNGLSSSIAVQSEQLLRCVIKTQLKRSSARSPCRARPSDLLYCPTTERGFATPRHGFVACAYRELGEAGQQLQEQDAIILGLRVELQKERLRSASAGEVGRQLSYQPVSPLARAACSTAGSYVRCVHRSERPARTYVSSTGMHIGLIKTSAGQWRGRARQLAEESQHGA